MPGRQVKIAVAIFKSDSATPAPDPLVFLQGGPGGASIALVASAVAPGGPFAGALARREVIAIDQRGTGRSQPSLECPELNQAAPMGGGMMMAMDAALPAIKQCHDRLVSSGVPLGEYATNRAADDVEAVRRALGKMPWNILGGSYGTRLALEVLRSHPEGVRSVILDSVSPPDVDLIADSPTNYLAALERLFATCAAQPACAAAYPNLGTVFRDTIAKLDAMPALFGQLNGRTFALLITQLLPSAALVAEVPEIVFQARDNQFTILTRLLMARQMGGAAAAISYGLHFSVMCADYFPFTSRATIEARAAQISAELRPALSSLSIPYIDRCGVWGVPPSPAALARPVASDKPALVLTGAIDPATPPAWARKAAQTLSASHLLELRGVGHGVFPTACGSAALGAFLDKPAEKPAPACLGTLTDVQLKVQR
jgi:pimeloyl-ACP methyl ester carboxylesterase